MIKTENHMGKINISDEYIINVINETVGSCFGVAGLNENTPMEAFLSHLTGRKSRNIGVGIATKGNALTVTLHISVMFGTNIAAVVSSIRHKVRFALKEAAGIDVEKVNVYIDEIIS